MPAICDLCKKPFKNTQGLSGHRRFFHGEGRDFDKMSKSDKVQRAQSLHSQNYSLGEIGKILHCSKATVKNYLEDYPYKERGKPVGTRTLLPYDQSLLQVDQFFTNLGGLLEEVKQLRWEKEEWKKKAEKWAKQILELQALLRKRD